MMSLCDLVEVVVAEVEHPEDGGQAVEVPRLHARDVVVRQVQRPRQIDR